MNLFIEPRIHAQSQETERYLPHLRSVYLGLLGRSQPHEDDEAVGDDGCEANAEQDRYGQGVAVPHQRRVLRQGQAAVGG